MSYTCPSVMVTTVSAARGSAATADAGAASAAPITLASASTQSSPPPVFFAMLLIQLHMAPPYPFDYRNDDQCTIKNDRATGRAPGSGTSLPWTRIDSHDNIRTGSSPGRRGGISQPGVLLAYAAMDPGNIVMRGDSRPNRKAAEPVGPSQGAESPVAA